MGQPGTSHVEEDLEAVRKERPGGPIGKGHVRGQKSDARGLVFLRDTRVEKMLSLAPRRENWWEEGGDSESEGEEGGLGPP